MALPRGEALCHRRGLSRFIPVTLRFLGTELILYVTRARAVVYTASRFEARLYYTRYYRDLRAREKSENDPPRRSVAKKKEKKKNVSNEIPVKTTSLAFLWRNKSRVHSFPIKRGREISLRAI